jgi:uncharacterized membrane protein
MHVIGATVILGTGIGIAFFMLVAHLSSDVRFIAKTAGAVVLADMVFTATAVIVQPVTGYFLVQTVGVPWSTSWVVWSLVLYVVAGLSWLPVVWMQAKMRDIARAADADSAPLPQLYHRLFRAWFLAGIPGFGSVLVIIWLMVAKPV